MASTRSFQTRAIHGDEGDGVHRPSPRAEGVAGTLELSTTYRWPDLDAGAEYVARVEPETFYRRLGSPNVAALERRIAALEGCPRALGLASGMAACSLAILATMPEGGELVCARTVYGEVATFLRTIAPRFGITARFVGGPALERFSEAITPRTRAVFVECPANPTLDLVDLAGVSSLARAVGAVTLCDATLATPYNCRPREHGIDVVVHSATKYLAGHSDALGGLIVGDAAVVDAAWSLARVFGPTLSPFDAWLIDRGLRTLGLRMERHNSNGSAVSDFLAGHPAVEAVAYPTVGGHSSTERARAQHAGFAGVVSFVPRGGVEASRSMVSRLRLFTMATSLGGVESLVQFPASMARLTGEQRAALGIPEGMVRLAAGLEDHRDLVEDLRQALEG